MEEDDNDAPPTFDSLEEVIGRAVAAPSIQPVLAAGAVIADRYVIEAVLGAGGMGTVYRARDRSLDREVAIKLHRTIAASDRLRREAIAMAKLAHPNVVAVFEVGELEGRPFVAMEYVPGATLRAWLEAEPRARREILDALTAAADGLAAAHDSGLVHRDVKPDNIFVGSDRRVRIGDFGLAQLANDARTGSALAGATGDHTMTGSVLGTPAYMAPEQIEGKEVDARTDQFAFAVVAWEALSGQRPFAGATIAELHTAITRGVPQHGRDRIPPRLRRVLQRGLAANPAERWPSLRALLAALRAAYFRPRVIGAITAVAVLGAAATTWAVWPEEDPVAACAAVATELETVLPVAETTKLVSAVRTSGAPHADDRARVIDRVLGTLRLDHQKVSRSACEARARRQWSAELATTSRECRETAARTAREMLAAVPIAADSIPDLVQIAAQLPTVETCGDARILAGRRSLAVAGFLLDDVIGARAKLEVARTQLVIGRVVSARATRAAIAASAVATHPTIAPQLAYLDGQLQMHAGDYAEAERSLSEIYFAARARDDGELTLQVVADLISLSAGIRRDPEASQRWIQNGLADAERERSRLPALSAHVIEAAATAAAVEGDSEVALSRVARAEELGRGTSRQLQSAALLGIKASALSDLGRVEESVAASDAQLSILVHTLDEHHPGVADAFSARAATLTTAGRIEGALEAARRAQAIVDTEVASGSAMITAQINVGVALININDNSGALYLERARTSLTGEFGEDHHDVALIDSNLALVYMDRGEGERALAALRHSVDVQGRTLGANHVELAASLYNLAVAEREAKAYDAALATARRAETIFALRMRGSARHVFSMVLIAMIQNLAARPADALATADSAIALVTDPDEPVGPGWARLEAARALITLGRDPVRARRLLGEARAAYIRAAIPERVTEVDGLLAKLR